MNHLRSYNSLGATNTLLMREELVFPGQFLTVEEEYSPGQNVWLADDGRIFADSVGVLDYDVKNRVVHVKKQSKSNLPLDAGTIILGQVAIVKDSQVIVDFISAQKDGVSRTLTFSGGTIMVSRAAQSYVKRLKDFYKVGDLVYAKIVDVKPYGVELACNEPSLGVLYAFCTRCKHPLNRNGEGVVCPSCGQTDVRKLSDAFVSPTML